MAAGNSLDRRDSGVRLENTAQAAAHRAPNPVSLEGGAARVGCGGVNRTGRYVRKRKIELGLAHGEAFIPQTHQWGQEGQVDWYEAYAEIDGEERKVYVFCMRGMASGGVFHRAYPHASQQAFLEAHGLAFEYFGGVFKTLRFDNPSSAVKKILRGHELEKIEW